jgi:hypothetical protein
MQVAGENVLSSGHEENPAGGIMKSPKKGPFSNHQYDRRSGISAEI